MTTDRHGAAEEKGNALNGVRISDLIAAPLTAAADAQSELAARTVEFIRSVGMETDRSGRTTAKNISFDVKMPSDGVVMCGQVSSSAEQTRETNQSAKYQISVKARKQQTPEGLSRLLDILASAVQGA